MKKSVLLLLALVAMLPATLPARDYTRLHLSDVEVSLSEGNHAVNVTMTVNPKDWKLGLNRYVVLTPVIRSASSSESVSLTPVTVAGRNMYYSLMRDENPNGGYLLRAGHGKPLSYTATVPMESWMELSDVDFTFSREGCCGNDVAPEEKLPLARIDLTPVEYTATLAYMEPMAAPKEARHISGKAYVVFPVNKTYIDPNYVVDGQRPNIPELGKITASIDTVKFNSDATVNSIKLTGFASPEGAYANNQRLAAGRTEAVKEYVRKKYDFPASVYQTASVAEDWEGLRDSVAASTLPDRDAILALIDDKSIPVAVKNDRLRAAFPQTYAHLLKNVYPWLRHTNYDITYTIKEYDNIDEIMTVLKTKPGNLSLREFYLAANSLKAGSPEYDDVWLTAVLMYPNDELANINAAYAYINRGDLASAERHLAKTGDSADASFAKGVLEAKKGNYDKARELIGAAKAKGHARADEALNAIAKVQAKRDNVTYTYSE